MFQKILQWIREIWSKMINTSSVKTALHVDVAITPLMIEALQKWSLMYINQSPWLTTDIKSLNLAASISSRVASTITLEMKVIVSGSPRADYLNEQMQAVLSDSRNNVEFGLAKGGMMFKPYVRGDKIIVDRVQADMFLPIVFDSNGIITSCIFEDHKTIGQYFYTRLEWHQLLPGGYCWVQNYAYRSSVRDTLGSKIPLSYVSDWANIKPNTGEANEIIDYVENVEKLLVGFFKTPFANNIEPTSPLPVSVFSRAVGQIEQADRQWSDFLWEFESGKRALYTDVLAFGRDSEGKPLLPDKRLYRLLDLNSKIDQKGLFEDWTPTLRDVNILNGLDAILRRIEFNCGLSYGVISDPQAQALTATEVRQQKQEYYVTITDCQKALKTAYDDLLYAMDVYATLYNLAPAGSYTTTYQFDDSVLSDHDTQFSQDQMSVIGNTMPKYIFNMRNYGLSEEDAKKWVVEAQAESPAPSFFPADNLGL